MGKVYVGIIGYGTVGMGTARILIENKELIRERTGQEIILKKMVDLDIVTRRKYQVDDELLTTDVKDILNDPQISIVVESIGGVNPAKTFILEAIRKKKNIVTPNKEVIAKHGREIFKAAQKKGVDVFCEGAVGGGIPLIRPLKLGLGANHIQQIYGIVNGTTNYILTKMSDHGCDFEQTLKEAQDKGYAEANPSSDIDGYDSAYKLVIMASIAFDAEIDLQDVYFEGIRNLRSVDFTYAKEFGYEIKLLAIGKMESDHIEVRVHPVMIATSHPLAKIKGVNNAVYVKNDFAGEIMFFGPGAGSDPTASSIASDIMDIVYNLGQPLNKHNLRADFKKIPISKIGNIYSEYYLRLNVADKPGVLADIAHICSKNKVSIKSVLQKDSTDSGAEIVIITHEVKERAIQKAVKKIKNLPNVYEINNLIRVGI